MSGPAPPRWAWGFVFLATLTPSLLSAHDLWLLAGQYRVEPFETTRAFINSGDEFPQSLTLIGEHRVTSLALHGPGESEPITDFRVERASLTFEITPEVPGSHVLALSTRARSVRLKAEDFHDYLDENGLDAIAAMRDELGERSRAAVERYSKWAKALIEVEGLEAPESEPAWSEPVGHTIEIVPTKNPNVLVTGDELDVRVLFHGEPLAGAQLSGGRAGGGAAREILTTTDEEGVATATLSTAGRWYLRAIHMIRDDEDPEVRWESFWATLTFEVR